MKKQINPYVGIGIVAVVLILILVGMYRHTFRPSEGSLDTLPPEEKAKIIGLYAGHAKASPPNAAPAPSAPVAGTR